MKRISSLFLAAVLALSLAPAALAVSRPATTFSDLPTGHWGYADIMSLYQGGLVNGMGEGQFGPDRQLTVAEMATMIANAQGVDLTPIGTEAWFVPPMRHAKEIGIIANWIDPTSAAEADKPCSREQAVYMVINGLGIASGLTPNAMTMNDIPDFGQAEAGYRDAVLQAYKYGIITGKDANKTFYPKDTLTRAEVCAILNRAGYNEAKEPVAETSDGLTGQQMLDKLKATGWFTESRESGWVHLTPKERKYQAITIEIAEDGRGGISISGKEWVYSLATDGESGVYDENGKIVSRDREYYNTNGKFIPASAYSYNGRQFLKQVLQVIFPKEWDKAYASVKVAMTAPYTYAFGSSFPSALGWYEGHCFEMTTSDFMSAGNGYEIYIGELNNEKVYEADISKAESAQHYSLQYVVKGTASNFISVERAYELDRW